MSSYYSSAGVQEQLPCQVRNSIGCAIIDAAREFASCLAGTWIQRRKLGPKLVLEAISHRGSLRKQTNRDPFADGRLAACSRAELTAGDRLVHDHGLVSVLWQIHDELDAAVAD